VINANKDLIKPKWKNDCVFDVTKGDDISIKIYSRWKKITSQQLEEFNLLFGVYPPFKSGFVDIDFGKDTFWFIAKDEESKP
jgi:hypothetical protein